MDDVALVKQALDALLAMEDRLEELAPGITDDPDAVLPEPGGRWKHEGFPRAGLALLFRMMQTGSQDLEGTASAWKLYQDAMRDGREKHRGRYRAHEPLRLALWEHGCARHWRFPPPSASCDAIESAFAELRDQQAEYFGQGLIQGNSGNAVGSQRTREKHKDIAERFHELHMTDPEQFPRSGAGYTAAAVVMTDEGFEKVGKSTVEAAYMKSDLYLSAVIFGALESPKNRR